MIAVVLDKQNLSCEKICADIQKLIHEYARENGDVSNSVMTINIAKISEGSIKKESICIEHKPE